MTITALITNLPAVSSIDGIALVYEVWFKPATLAPVVVIMEGYDGTPANMPTDDKIRFAQYGFFCVFPYLRGRGSSGGSMDSDGYETQDIIDCVNAARALFPYESSGTVANIVGYSGGGGNVLGALSRFPDFFAAGVDHFGMSSFSQWWTDNSGFRTKMNTRIGGDAVNGTPANVPDAYAARQHRAAIINFTGGYLFIFHDLADVIVLPAHSAAVVASMAGAGLTNYAYNTSQAWGHTYPIPAAEPYWTPQIAAGTYSSWTVAVSGTLKVEGYLDTKRFRVTLGTGLAEFGQVVYNMTTRVFTITSDTGAATYTLKLKGQASSASISATINGVGDTQTSDSSGNVTFTGSV